MAVVEIIIIVGLYSYILFYLPQFRLAGGIIAAALLGGLAYYLLSSDPVQQAELRRIDIAEVTLEDVDLEIGIRTSTLTGRVINGSETFDLTGILLDVTLYDCPKIDSDLADCFTIGQDSGEARVAVPPGQLREFNTNLLFVQVPEVTGIFRWTHIVTGLRALEK